MLIEVDNERFCPDFIRLNEQWISTYFSIEESDRKLASDPFGIVRDGGHIFSLVEDGRVVGVCALIKEGGRRFQLVRMAVDPSEQGKGHGDSLITAALDAAKEDGASTVYLLTNTALCAAVSLYRKHGFITTMQGPHLLYARCNIVMELQL